VPIVNGHAEVDLSPEALNASPEARAAMFAQLSQTLSQASVTSISVTADGTAIELPKVGFNVTRPAELGYDIVRAPSFDSAWLRNERTLTSIDPSFQPDGEVTKQRPSERWPAEIPTTWVSLAMSADSREIAAVGGDRKELSRWPIDSAVIPYRNAGTDLTRPTYDVADFLWYASTNASGNVGFWTINTGVQGSVPRPVAAPWLRDRKVVTLTIAPDRARALIVTSDARGDQRQLLIAGVVRSADGAPTALAEPLRLGQPLTTIRDVVWLGPSAYAVLGRTSESASVLPILGSVGGGLALARSPGSASSGQSGPLPPVAGAESLTTVGGPLGLIVVTDSSVNKVQARVASTWREIGTGSELLVPGR
jgi:hypothetical protein